MKFVGALDRKPFRKIPPGLRSLAQWGLYVVIELASRLEHRLRRLAE